MGFLADSGGVDQVTTYASAENRFGSRAMVFRVQGRDHREMVKFGENDAEYTNLENLIIRMIRTNHGQEQPTSAENAQDLLPRSQTLPERNRRTFTEDGQYQGSSFRHIININNHFSSNNGSRNHSPPADASQTWTVHDRSGADRSTGHSRNYFGQHSDKHARAIPPLRSFDSAEAIQNMDQPSDNIWLGPQAAKHQTHNHPHSSNNDNDKMFNRLMMFDTVFILDDTGSMDESVDGKDSNGAKRWVTAKEALVHIGRIATDKDPDGVDLRFLKSDEVADNITNVDDLIDKLECAELDELGGGTFFQERLEEIVEPRLAAYRAFKQSMQEYNLQVQRLAHDKKARARLVRPKEPKKLNLIVITDGSADDEPEVESYIIEVARELDLLGAKLAQIGIQFVQVGDDSDAAEFLRRLDDELQNRTTPPIRDVSLSTLLYS